MTNKEIVSEVIGDLRALQVDDRISERYVLSKLKGYNGTFLKRENDQLRLYDDNNVWYPIECLEMETLDPKAYPDGCRGTNVIDKIHNYTRSLYPIPTLYSSKTGPLIREIQTMDDAGIYQPTTPVEYARIINREFQNPNIRYFWFDGKGRLVIPNSATKLVTMTASFMDPWKATLIDSCKALTNRTIESAATTDDCSRQLKTTVTSYCPEPMDDPFLCPTHLLATVKEAATKDLFDFYKRNITDPVPDDDNNSKQSK